MSTIRVEQLLQEIESLTPHERQLISDRLATSCKSAVTPNGSLGSLYRELVNCGILLRSPNSAASPSASLKRKLIPIKGTPLSETIIQERR